MLSDPPPNLEPARIEPGHPPEEQEEMEEMDSFIEVSSEPMPSPQWLSGGRGLWLGLVAGLAIAGGGMALTARSAKQAILSPKIAPGSQQSVSVATAQWMPISLTFPVQGSVEARNWVSVMPKSAGVQIKSILVQEGIQVKAGQVIAVLDNSVQREQLNQAQAQAASVQAQVAGAETQLLSAQAQVQAAQAQLTSAQTVVAQKQAQFRQQQASFKEAQSNQQRYASLAQQGAISAQELEARSTAALTAQSSVQVAKADIGNAQAGVTNALAQLEQAKATVYSARAGVTQAQANRRSASARQQELTAQLEQASLVKAPANGVIAKKNANVGDLTGTAPLFSIIQDSSIELQAKVPEPLLAKVRLGAPAFITSDSDRRVQVEGTVRDINPVVDAKTRQALVKINLPNSPLLKPGMFLKAAIAFNTAQAITVPDGAVVAQTDGQTVVYVLNADNVAKAQTIQIGDASRGRVEVKTGLKSGDRVVVSGAGFVKDGDRVNVVQ
ncbi:MAG: efflux RND transporter periplasmic adaptor subunit [Acaryochloridaceae cyanobacterium RU_4_10]|nr:efflux RND transporter periplasmic adaptor subunit [Acaryochloridaceae cyanobacterium RU_4_10]